jgi:hypothetical protein
MDSAIRLVCTLDLHLGRDWTLVGAGCRNNLNNTTWRIDVYIRPISYDVGGRSVWFVLGSNKKNGRLSNSNVRMLDPWLFGSRGGRSRHDK